MARDTAVLVDDHRGLQVGWPGILPHQRVAVRAWRANLGQPAAATASDQESRRTLGGRTPKDLVTCTMPNVYRGHRRRPETREKPASFPGRRLTPDLRTVLSTCSRNDFHRNHQLSGRVRSTNCKRNRCSSAAVGAGSSEAAETGRLTHQRTPAPAPKDRPQFLSGLDPESLRQNPLPRRWSTDRPRPQARRRTATWQPGQPARAIDCVQVLQVAGPRQRRFSGTSSTEIIDNRRDDQQRARRQMTALANPGSGHSRRVSAGACGARADQSGLGKLAGDQCVIGRSPSLRLRTTETTRCDGARRATNRFAGRAGRGGRWAST